MKYIHNSCAALTIATRQPSLLAKGPTPVFRGLPTKYTDVDWHQKPPSRGDQSPLKAG